MKISSPIGNETIEITSDYGPRWNRQHKGVDLKAKPGTRITSVLPGIVEKSGNFNDGYGGQVLIKHDTDQGVFYSRYAHLRKNYVKRGEEVKAGQKIGESGGEKGDPNSGRSTGPHLHFEFMKEGMSPIDPSPYLVGAVAAGAVASELSKSTSEPTQTTSTSGENFVDKVMRGVAKVATPVGLVTGLKGLSTKKESVEDTNLMEEISRIKQLLK
jgi:hypothetical protein